MRTVIVADTTLHHVAARELGAASQWWRIARANGLADTVVTGVVTLLVPDADASAGDGIPAWEPTSKDI